MRAGLKILGRLVVVGALVLLATEVAVALFLNSPSPYVLDDELGFSYILGSTVFSTREGGARIRFNRLRLNDGEISSKDGRMQLFVLGDSQTEAL